MVIGQGLYLEGLLLHVREASVDQVLFIAPRKVKLFPKLAIGHILQPCPFPDIWRFVHSVIVRIHFSTVKIDKFYPSSGIQVVHCSLRKLWKISYCATHIATMDKIKLI